MAVRAYFSTDPGAPTLSGTVGELANVLKKCLIDGYGSRTPPGGWTHLASGNGQKLALRSTASGATGFWIHVDDSGSVTPQSAMVRCYESLTGLDANGDPVNPFGMFPTPAQETSYGAKKSQSSDNAVRPWAVVADERAFYLMTDPSTSNGTNGFISHFFGDVLPLRADDYYACMCAFSINQAAGGATFNHVSELERIQVGSGYNNSQKAHYMARRYDGTGGSTSVSKCGDVQSASNSVIGNASGLPYPSPLDGSLCLGVITVFEPMFCFRAKMPGFYQPLHTKPLPHLATITDVQGLSGHTLQAFYTFYGPPGEIILDVTGPWR